MVRKMQMRRRRPVRRQNLKKVIKSVLMKNVEKKFNLWSPVSPTSDFNNTNPLDESLTDISQGVAQTGRVGNQIKMTGQYGKVFLVNTGANTSLVRWIMYIPKEANDALSSLQYSDPIDKDRYTVLEDRFLTLGSLQNDNGSIPATKIVNIRRRLRNTVQFSGSGATSYTKNPIKVYAVSNSADNISVRGYVYSYFTDL